MSSATYTGWRKWVIRKDETIPFICFGVVIAAVLFTLGERQGWHAHHALHHPTLHYLGNHPGMWIFFSFLGLEITIGSLIKAGKFAGLATVGGMIVPPLVTYGILRMLNVEHEIAMYIAIGACATDVAFSLGAASLVTKGKKVLALTIAALLILAVGDDMCGVMVIAGLYADNVSEGYLWFEVVIIGFAYFCGERGNFMLKSKKGDGPWELVIYDIEINSTTFWVALALVNTGVLHLGGIEWVLGGCMVFIFAPKNVKETLIAKLKPFIPLVLFLFGLSNGGIDLMKSSNWGTVTAACCIGGMFGKQIGIFSFGLWGRFWSSKNGSQYGRTPIRQVYAMALFGSVNGAVAIFFVATGMAKGKIPDEMASQAILGYFLTVPAVYLQTLFGKAVGLLKDDPNFQPEKEKQKAPTTSPAAVELAS